MAKRVMILATNGFEQSELEVPLEKLRNAGATVDVVSIENGEITGWEKKDWGSAVKVDVSCCALPCSSSIIRSCHSIASNLHLQSA